MSSLQDSLEVDNLPLMTFPYRQWFMIFKSRKALFLETFRFTPFRVEVEQYILDYWQSNEKVPSGKLMNKYYFNAVKRVTKGPVSKFSPSSYKFVVCSCAKKFIQLTFLFSRLRWFVSDVRSSNIGLPPW